MKPLLLLFSLTTLLLLSGCGGPQPTPPAKKPYYTQVNMWYIDRSYVEHVSDPTVAISKNEEVLRADYQIESTNFQRDVLLPINSEVEIVKMGRDALFFRYDGKLIALVDVKKYSQVALQELFDRTFKEQPVDLSVYPQETRANIMAGRVTKGMSKAEMILTRGYPPAHRTPTLERDDWQYWNGRFNSRIYHFEDGKYTGYTD